MLRNNADARRCSYFELGLPVGTQILNKHYACTNKNHTNGIFFGKIPKTCCFYSLERLLFLSRIFSDTFFLSFFAYVKKMEKLPIFDQNQWQPLWKNPKFLTFLTCCFYSVERLFYFLEYFQTHFAGLFCLYFSKIWKNCQFLTKAMD